MLYWKPRELEEALTCFIEHYNYRRHHLPFANAKYYPLPQASKTKYPQSMSKRS